MSAHKYSRDEAYKKYRDDPKAFFENEIHDRADDSTSLINPDWPRCWTTYHYNLVEIGIIEILMQAEAVREKITVLDIGIGTGHWLKFYRTNFDIKRLVGVDFCETPIERAKERKQDSYADLLLWDISETPPCGLAKTPFDVINCIGIMFHIVDDSKWEKAFHNLAGLLADKGVMIIGGDFGEETVERGIMRKSRSLKTWEELAAGRGMEIFSVKRFDWWAGADKGGITDNLIGIRAG